MTPRPIRMEAITAAVVTAADFPEPGACRMEAPILLLEHRPADMPKGRAAPELLMMAAVEAAASTADTAQTTSTVAVVVAQAMYLAWQAVLPQQVDITAGTLLCGLEPGMVMDMQRYFCTGRQMTRTVTRNG